MAKKKAPGPAGAMSMAFNAKLDEIVKRGRAVGMTLTDICREANTARATPDRWRKNPPLSVQIIDRMDNVVSKAERESTAG